MRFFQGCLSFLMLGCSITSIAQHSSDSVVRNTAIDKALDKSIKIQQSIYVGSEYGDSPYSIANGHQFYLSDQQLPGSVLYNGILYQNLKLQYDIIRDEVVMEHPNGRKFLLVKEKITEFTLDGHHFEKIKYGTKNDEPSFYDVLADRGNVKLLAKRTKVLRGQNDVLVNKQKSALVGDETLYYLVRDEKYYVVNNYKDILRILYRKQKKPSTAAVKKAKRGEGQMIAVINQYTGI